MRRLPGVRTAKTAAAGAGAYAVGLALTDDPKPVLAALTALLVVQLTLHDSVREGGRRVIAVTAGVLVAVGFSLLTGLTWWSVALVIALGVGIGRLLRVGPQLMEVPISAMLVLAVGGQSAYAVDRVEETLLGAAVGLIVHLLVAPPLYLKPAAEALADLAVAIEGLLRRMAERPAVGEEGEDTASGGWLADARDLGRRAVRLDDVVQRAERSLRMNPRGAWVAPAQPSLQATNATLEHCAVAVRSIARNLPLQRPPDDEAATQLSRTLAACADAVHAFAAHAGSDPYAPTGDVAALVAAVDQAREHRAATDLALRVHPDADAAVWRQHGALLAGIDRLITELDPRADVAARQVTRPAGLDPLGRAKVQHALAAGRRRRTRP